MNAYGADLVEFQTVVVQTLICTISTKTRCFVTGVSPGDITVALLDLLILWTERRMRFQIQKENDHEPTSCDDRKPTPISRR
ncbi:hypothetical protein NPIL_588141 [Nephila pilipes]|uniref:Uncharacterized protein n=1 Tax=Nephila pilipes TaxID=299642 RepID=A0A8X6QSD2_NEPPI|nr:hypothetical protein NPIL_588141 [Nephila pilipes]